MKARETDPRSGDILSGGMEDYRIPGIADTPEFEVHFDEGGFDHVLGGSVGIGEVRDRADIAGAGECDPYATGIRLTRHSGPAGSPDRALKGRTAA